jgi:hypothetical protein
MSETPEQFTLRANSLLQTALRLSTKESGDYAAFERCMVQAKTKRMTRVEGLDYTVKTLRGEL